MVKEKGGIVVMDDKKKQMATDYIVYMMVGSYFVKTICSSKTKEKRLFLYYKDIKDSIQYEIEEKCINYVEKKMIKELPPQIWKERVSVTLKSNLVIPSKTDIVFAGNGWRLNISSDYSSLMKGKMTYDLIEDTDYMTVQAV